VHGIHHERVIGVHLIGMCLMGMHIIGIYFIRMHLIGVYLTACVS
jgi:hypothetical protein